MSKLAIGGALRGFQLLRLDQEPLLLERLFQFLPLQRLSRLPLATTLLLVVAPAPLTGRRLNPFPGCVEEGARRGGRLAGGLLKSFAREELVSTHTLVPRSAVIPEVAPRIDGQALLLLEARFRPTCELEFAYAHLCRGIVVVLRGHRRYEYGGPFPLGRLSSLGLSNGRVPLRPGRDRRLDGGDGLNGCQRLNGGRWRGNERGALRLHHGIYRFRNDPLLFRPLIQTSRITLVVLRHLLVVEQLRLQRHRVDKHARVGPVHESRIGGEHGIDYIVVVVHVAPTVTNNQRIQQRTITRFGGESGSYALDLLPVARRLALNLSRLVHVPVLPQQPDLQLIQIPDAQVQRLVLLPRRILHDVERAPRLLRQSFLQQAADPVLHVRPLERNRVRGDPLSAIELLPPWGEPSLLVARGSRQYGPVIFVYQVANIRLLRLPPPPRLAVVQRDLAHVREIRVFHGRPGLARLGRGLLLLLIVIMVVGGGGSGGGGSVVERVRGGGRDHGSSRDRRLIRVVRCHRGALAGRDLRAELLLHRRDPLQPAVHVGYGAWRRGGAGWRWAGYRRLRQSSRRRVQSLLGEGRLVVVEILRRQRLVVELELPSRLPAPTTATDFPRPEF